MEELKPIAMPGTHQSFLKYFKKQSVPTNLKILDVGAGHGAFTKTLYDMGYDVEACDLFPEYFYFKKIRCEKVDVTQKFPYPDNSFDIAIAIEVSEHILNHDTFFGELNRILKPNGQLFISTPNILSLKSRLKFLFHGFFYSFDSLEKGNHNGLQHVASLTFDQYHYLVNKNGFRKPELDIDKRQNTSIWLLFMMYPVLWSVNRLKKNTTTHNHPKLLLGRLLFLNFRNNKSSVHPET